MRSESAHSIPDRRVNKPHAITVEDSLEELNDNPHIHSHKALFSQELLLGFASRLAEIPDPAERQQAMGSLVAKRLKLTLVPQIKNSSPGDEGAEIPQAVVKFMHDYKEGAFKVLLGFGKSAMVLESMRYNDRCHKIRLPSILQPAGTNTPDEEKNIQEKIAHIKTNSGVKVPMVKAYIDDCGGIIVMERIAGVTVKDVLEKDVPLPPSYKHEQFFGALEQFVSDMHNAGYYHRDLHTGNIMIDDATGMPFIIDFGMSIHTNFPDDEVFHQEVAVDGHMKDLVLKSDESWVKITKSSIASYLTNRKDL